MNFASVSEAELAPGGNGASHRLNHNDRPPLAGIWRDTMRIYWCFALRASSGIYQFSG